MDAPTPVTLKFPQFGNESETDPNEDPPEFIKEPVTDSSEIVADLDSPHMKPVVHLPRMGTIANFTSITGAALISGALVQVYYSGLAPTDAWSAPAVYSFLAVMLLCPVVLFFIPKQPR